MLSERPGWYQSSRERLDIRFEYRTTPAPKQLEYWYSVALDLGVDTTDDSYDSLATLLAGQAFMITSFMAEATKCEPCLEKLFEAFTEALRALGMARKREREEV